MKQTILCTFEVSLFNKIFVNIFFLRGGGPSPCKILAPQPGIEPEPPAVEAQSLNHCEIPHDFYFILSSYLNHQVTALSVIASK